MYRNRMESPACRPRHSRAGLFAFGEVTVVVVLLVGLFWIGSQLTSMTSLETEADRAVVRANSDRPVLRMSTDENGDHLWVFRPADEVVLMNLASGQIEKSRWSPGIRVSQVAHSRDTATSLIAGENGSLCLHRDGREPVYVEFPSQEAASVDVAVSADGSLVLSATRAGHVNGWDLTNSQAIPVAYSLGQAHRLDRMCLDGAGDRIFVAFSDGSASIHEARTGRLLIELPKSDTCTAATWSADGQSLALATTDCAIRLVDATTGTSTWHTKSSHTRNLMRITTLAISPDGRWVAAVGFSKQIVVWDVTAPDTIRRLSGHDGIVRVVAFSPQANTLFSGSLDGTIREWSMETFVPLRRLE